MKVVLILVSCFVAVFAVSVKEQWISFKKEHGKTYKSAREEYLRFGIFQQNLRKIEAHNAKYDQGKESYMMGVNKFADLTQDEFEKMVSMPQLPPSEPDFVFSARSYAEAAKSVDWREKGAVTPVLNQFNCGSCWAFSSVGAIEGQHAIKHNSLVALSPQELLDCSGSYGTGGCHGGWMYDAFRYVKDHEIGSLKDYEYHGLQKPCQNSSVPRVPVNVTGYAFVDRNMEAVRQAVEHIGPLSIALNSTLLHFYSKGIIDTECRPYTSHAVLLVGYGTENGKDFWILKNSWGKELGENGYVRIVRNEQNPCGIYDHAMFPIVD